MVFARFSLRLVLPVLFISLFASLKPAEAFDAGYHHDITRSVLSEAGFAEGAVNSVILANWLTDYYSNAPSSNPRLRPFLQTLHFDNLPDSQSVQRYYGWLMHNTKRLTQEAANGNDRVKMLAIIGLASHAVQDFYAHSNWTGPVTVGGTGAYLVSLLSPAGIGSRQVFTGTWPNGGVRAHGGYFSGLNKDSHVRPGWENAYVHAHLATARLVRNMKVWAEQVRPEFWRRTASINLARLHQKQLKRDLDSAMEISMTVRAKVLGIAASDGHWKGNLSGDGAAFAAAVAEFSGWKNSFMSRYFRTSKLPFDLAENLMSAKLPPQVELPVAETDAREVLVFTVHSFAYTGNGPAPKSAGLNLKINGTEYVGRRIRSGESYQDTGAAWAEIHIDAAGTSKFEIELVMKGYDGAGDQQAVAKDINFRPGKKTLQLVYDSRSKELSGDVFVIGDGNPQRVTVTGDGERSAAIEFSVFKRRLVHAGQ